MLNLFFFWLKMRKNYQLKFIWLKRKDKGEIVVLNGPEFNNVVKIYTGDFCIARFKMADCKLFMEKKKMGCLKIPQTYSIPKGQKANWIAKRIGIKFNGKIRPFDVVGYNVAEGWIDTVKGERLLGIVEPFWR